MLTTGRMTRPARVLLRLAAVLLVAVAVLLVHSGAAVADTGGDSATSNYQVPCSGAEGTAAERVAGDDLLPVNRWSPATNNFHSRTDGIKGAIQAVRRDVGAGMFMSIGNGMWSVTSDITLFATRFCLADTAGTVVDSTAGDLMDSVVSGGLAPYLVALLVGSFGFSIWNGFRRRGAVDWKAMGGKAGALALLFTLMVGAQATDPQQGRFGAGSPGWWITTVNDTVSDIGSVPALYAAQVEANGDQSDTLSCQAYVTELKQRYQGRYSGSLTASAASMPIVLNSIWEQTGQEAWKTAQFGQSEYGDRVYCRLMDQFADVPVGAWPQQVEGIPVDEGQQRAMDWYSSNGSSTTIGALADIPGVPYVRHPNSIAFTPVNDITRDVSLVGWAVCEYNGTGTYNPDNWSYRTQALLANDIPATDQGSGDDPDSARTGQTAGGQGCAGWWSERAVAGTGGFNDGGSAFDWEADPERVLNELDGPEQDFMLTLHSYKAGNSVAVSFFYALSATVMFVVFGLVSMGIVLAKFAMIVMMIGIVGVILSALLPRAGASAKLGGFAKTMLGLMILTSMTMVIFSVIGQLTQLSMEAGLEMFEPGTAGAMFWSAMSPIIAVFSLHWLFKKMNVTSPFTAQGVKAWGGAAPAVGGAVGGALGAGLLSRVGNRVKSEATNRVSSAVVGKATGGGKGRAPRRKGDGLTRQPKDRKQDEATFDVGTTEKRNNAGPETGPSSQPEGSEQARVASEVDASTGAVPDSLTSAAGTPTPQPEGRQSLRMARAERDESLLAQNEDSVLAKYGKGSLDELSYRERSGWLREHRKTQVQRAKELSLQEWDDKNAGTWRAMVHQRQRTNRDEGGGMSLRQHVNSFTGATKDRAKASVDAARQTYRTGGLRGVAHKVGDDVQRLRENTNRVAKTAAVGGLKVTGKTAAVGGIALGGLLLGGPAGVAIAGGVLAHKARKGWVSAADRRGAKQEALLQRLSNHDKARAAAAAGAPATTATGGTTTPTGTTAPGDDAAGVVQPGSSPPAGRDDD